ncbi:MAG TPA: PQQ-dependent sugar dehydrogenase [Solirubrobacterales bacterium]|nr:PQQ-dependent sugar dehydrogenase [Solirubrobacterales bacterium]
MSWVAVLGALLCALPGTTTAATLEPIGKFRQPMTVSSDPGNGERLLIAEREGVIVEVSKGATSQFADLSSLVSCCEVERGLLSIVLAPDFGGTGRFYAAYTGTPAAGGAEGDVHIDSFRPGPAGGAPIREPILSVDHAVNPNHNGGQLQFGPDGSLYISLGDGGGSGDPLESGQNTETLLGKILRIDPQPGQVPAYSIPPGNPFAGSSGLDEIWASGLRNPWRFSFDRVSGDMVIADVGQDAREEVDFAPSPGGGAVGGAGANYGWNCREGLIAYPEPAVACGSASGFTDPVFDYPHDDPGDGSASGCSIIGGYVVRDPSLGDLYGRYLYSDFCSKEIRSLILPATAEGSASDDRSEGLSVGKPSAFGEDACGRLYVASNEGTVYRLAGTTPAPCASEAVSKSSGGGSVLEPGAVPTQTQEQPRLRLRLRAGPTGTPSKILAQVLPCDDQQGQRVWLRRGGEPFGSKRLDRSCVARFPLRLRDMATFRAVLEVDGKTIRSSRLTVEPRRRGAR